MPAYVIFSDVALVQMARDYPANEGEFRRISGVGEHKLREFGDAFMGEIREHLRSNPRQTFRDEVASSPAKMGGSHHESVRRFRDGQSVEEIAAERGFVVGTILAHLGVAAEAGEEIDIDRFLTPEEQQEVEAAFAKIGWGNLTGVRDMLDSRFSYDVLRIFRSARRSGRAAANEDRPLTVQVSAPRGDSAAPAACAVSAS